MATVYNTVSTLSNNLITARDRAFEFGFTPELVFANLAQSKAYDQQSQPYKGSTVNFTIYNRFNPSTTTLSETTDPDGKKISNAQKSITLDERGDVITTSEKLRMESVDNLDTVSLELVGQNAGESTDIYARSKMDAQVGAAYVTYVGQTAKSAITKANILTTAIVAKTYTKLAGKNVPKIPGLNAYVWVGTAESIHDLKSETGTNLWTDVSKFFPDGIMGIQQNKIVGMYKGFIFVENSNCKVDYQGAALQTATTVAGVNAVGATAIAVTSGTGLDAGNYLTIISGTDYYTYEIVSRSTNTVTIGNCINLNGNVWREGSNGAGAAGLVVATAGSEVCGEYAAVHTNYAVGYQAMGYAFAVRPENRVTGPFDKLGRLMNVGWYSLDGFGELRAEALHKVYCGVSLDNNA